MLKDNGPRLLTVALSTGLIQTRHRQPASQFMDVAAMRVVALHAVHLPLQHRVVLRKLKLLLLLAMALETSRGVFAGIDDELAPAAAARDVQARRPVTRLATRLPCRTRIFQLDSGVRAGWKAMRDAVTTLGAGLVA
jgi:hypothetical protein